MFVSNQQGCVFMWAALQEVVYQKVKEQITWPDDDNSDAMNAQFQAQGIRQALQRGLGSAVGPHERQGVAAVDAADVDDAPGGARS